MPQAPASSDLDQRNSTRIILALVGLFVLLFILSLFGRPLFIPDEVRYGEIAREMLAHGNWVVPRLDGLLYFEKPPLGHWLNAISLYVFGENAFAVRFASALAAGVTAWIAYRLSRHFFESQRTALLAAFIYLTCFEVQVLGTFSVLDSILTLVLNAGTASIVLAARAKDPGAETRWLAAGGALLGLAFLAKGFLAFVIPGLVLVAWLVWERKVGLLLKRGWLAVLAAVVIVAPWAIAVHVQEPDFWRYFVVVEHLQRFAAQNAQHKAPVYYYLIALPVVAFPWFFLLPAALKGAFGAPVNAQHRSARILLALWILLPLAFFSTASGKLITYILPCFLPFSILLAHGLAQGVAGNVDIRGWIRIALGLVCLGFVVALIALLQTQLTSVSDGPYQASEMLKFYILALSLLFAAGFCLLAIFSKVVLKSVLAGGLAIAPVLFALQYVLPDEVMQHKAPGAFLERIAKTMEPDTVVITNGSLVRAVAWHLKRDNVYVIQDKGETAYGLDAPDGAGRFLTPLELAKILRDNAASRDVLIICKNPCEASTREFIPDDAVNSSYGNFYAYLIPKSVAATPMVSP